MAIVKNNFRVSRLEGAFSPESGDSMSSDDDELQRRNFVSESDGDDDDDDADSGAGSDDFDLSELGEIGAEFCQVGIQSCSIPFELYDLPDLKEILTLDAWNNELTEEERFSLAEYLPDMDQDTFMRTLKELFSGSNFQFGSPLVRLFDMLKGGLCEPRVNLYQQGLNFFQKREHYHLLRKYQNSMVTNLTQIKDAWQNYRGYSIEERLQVLNIMRSQKRSPRYEKMGNLGLETDSSEREESGEDFWSKRLKDIKLVPKTVPRLNTVSPTLNVPSQGRTMIPEPLKYGKQNPKGILKVAGSKVPSTKELSGLFRSIPHGLEMKSRPSSSALAHPWLDRSAGYDLGAAHRSRGYMKGEDAAAEEPSYEMSLQRDRNVTRGGAMSKVGLLKPGKIKKPDGLKTEDFTTDSFMELPLSIKNDLHSHGRNRNMNQMADIEMLTAKPKNNRISYDYHSRVAGKKAKNLEKLRQSAVDNQMKTAKDRAHHLFLKENQVDWSDGNRYKKTQEEFFSVDRPDDWNARSKNWRTGQEFQTGKNSGGPHSKVGSYRTFSPQMTDAFFHSDYRGKTSQVKIRRTSAQNGGLKMEELGGVTMFTQSEETESDSSEQIDEEEDINSLRSKLSYPSSVLEARHYASVKTLPDPKKGSKLQRKVKKENSQALDEVTYSSKKVGDLGERLYMPEVELYSSKGKQKGKIRDPSYLHNYATTMMEESNFSGSAKLADDDRRQNYRWGKNGQMQGEAGERSQLPVSKAYPAERQRKVKVDHDLSVPQSNYLNDISEEEDDLHVTNRLVDDHELPKRFGKKRQHTEAHVIDHQERSNMFLSGCNATKKRKGKADVAYMDGPGESDCLHSSPQQRIDEPTSLKKRGKKKMDAEPGSLAMVSSEPPVSEKGVAEVVPETRQPKRPFTLITPTVHTGFSFSIIHLLSAVRLAMISPYTEDTSEIGKHLEKSDGRQKSDKEEQNRKHDVINGGLLFPFHENVDINNSEHMGRKNLPSLTVQEIVDRVRSNPGDPCILETQEPLQELVRGVVKLFSSKTAPLGAKGWKALVVYERSTKSWSWVGPVSSSSSDHDIVEEETSSEAWGLPHKMLVKLVDSFANWLKNGQETLRQIGSLPAPPLGLIQLNLDEKERFRDLRAQKSLTTISQSSEELRTYFRREEVLRYSVPDRAFFYTATDGRKSIVAPLRRCGGKPTSKARDHFMLKPNRPPHVTILCLVRDAAARLPGSIGTRADVCTLIRDSQFIVEDVSDAQINQVVSGALDRLHYERDPCVQFDGDRKLWVYLHREREEEDFEDDGTSSTKKWKRQRKDATDQSDPGTVNVAYHGSGEQIGGGSAFGYDLSSDLNVEPLCMDEAKRTEFEYADLRPKVEENEDTYTGSAQGGIRQVRPMGWDVLGLNSLRDSNILCQENSTNEDFDDETFSREKPVELLSATLS